MRRWIVALLAIVTLNPCVSRAVDTSKIMEASLTVESHAMVGADGSLHDMEFKDPAKLSPAVMDFIQQRAMSWKVHFVSPPQDDVKFNITVKVIARQTDATHTSLRIAAADIVQTGLPETETINVAKRVIPTFPGVALQARMPGTVYLLVQVAPDGSVLNVAAEKVNLRNYDSIPIMMAKYRKSLADAAINAVKQWTFSVPATGPHTQQPYWYVRVPVNFYIPNDGMDINNGRGYGKWDMYIPGPSENIPWFKEPKMLADAPDAIPDGAVRIMGAGPQLEIP